MNKIEGIKSAIEGLRTCGEADKRLIWTERLVREVPEFIAKHERLEKEVMRLNDSIADYQEYQKSDQEDLRQLRADKERLEKEKIALNKHYQMEINSIEHTRIKLQRVCDCINKIIPKFNATTSIQIKIDRDTWNELQQVLKELK